MSGQEDWRTQLSQPTFEMDEWQIEVPVKARDGTQLFVDVRLPKGPAGARYPALLSMSPYGREIQHLAPPVGRESDYTRGTGGIESGMTDYFVPRGYVHVHGDPRGIGRSGGQYEHFGEQEQQDGYDLIEWIARQPWCNGQVGMLGMSYFAVNQLLVATQRPPSLKAIFVHDGYSDMYRQLAYHGGIFNFGFYQHIWRLFPTSTTQPISRRLLSEDEYEARLENIRGDRDLRGYPYLYKLTINPENNPLMLDLLMHPFDGEFYRERSAYPDFDKIQIPVFIVSRWSAWAIHLPGAIDAFYNLDVPRKMVVTETSWEGGFGRPWHENHDLVLRWYDHWLKGNDTGVMDEPPVRYFVKGMNRWDQADTWPPKGVSYQPYYLHEAGVLSDQAQIPHERPSRFFNEPWQAPGQMSESVKFTSAPVSTALEIAGPVALHFWASLSSDDANWFVQLRDVAPDGTAKIVTKGWLKASHRELDAERSTAERPYHPHVRRLETKPGETYGYQIDLRDTAHVFLPGHRMQILIKGQDSPWEDFAIWYHVNNMTRTEHTIHHDSLQPSHVLLPVRKMAD
ncbi:MAG: CocE/NonD family hydrolase [Burkholderiaceae bacterium]|nr:CocE/NonD family hydrolase [Burkholderiaceae bacterium]